MSKEHTWIKRKEILMVGSRGAKSLASKKIVEFYECKRCKLQVFKKGATRHKDCDECLALYVIEDGQYFG